MSIDLQMKINSDIRLRTFLRENPIWYKRLNRNPNLFHEFNLAMKDKYKLKTSDRITKMLDNLSMIEAFLDVLK